MCAGQGNCILIKSKVDNLKICSEVGAKTEHRRTRDQKTTRVKEDCFRREERSIILAEAGAGHKQSIGDIHQAPAIFANCHLSNDLPGLGWRGPDRLGTRARLLESGLPGAGNIFRHCMSCRSLTFQILRRRPFPAGRTTAVSRSTEHNQANEPKNLMQEH